MVTHMPPQSLIEYLSPVSGLAGAIIGYWFGSRQGEGLGSLRLSRRRLPVKDGLTPHGLRHSHKTWMVEDGIPEILAEQRLGHDVPGVRGLYAHASQRNREELLTALQARWEQSLRQRAESIRTPPSRCSTASLRHSAPTPRGRARRHDRGWTEELRPHLRDERPPDDATVVIRGGPDTLAKLTMHARRTHDAYVLDGEPLWGISVYCALDDVGPASLDGLLRRFASYRAVHLPRMDDLGARIPVAAVVRSAALHDQARRR